MYFVNDRSCTLTLPDPAPPPKWAEPDCDMPQLHDSTWISSLCLSSVDSPLIPSIFMNMSTAMDRLLFLPLHVNGRQLVSVRDRALFASLGRRQLGHQPQRHRQAL